MGFLFDDRYAGDFELFGWLHIVVLGLGVGSVFALYYLRERLTSPAIGRILRFSVATLIVVLEVVYQFWMASLHGWRWAEVAPLGLCAMMEWITVVTLVLDLKGVIKVVLPWAFVGASLSFIVVNMGTSFTFPHFRFFHYFGIHWLFLMANLFYLYTGRFRYTYRDLMRSSVWLGGVCLAVLAVDLATDQNFMFLRSWPEELDFVNELLPFPANTLALMLGVFILFNVFYLLFVIRRFDREADPAVIHHDELAVERS
jgi:hypothetical integral membrane protein (TIGR02206 family)